MNRAAPRAVGVLVVGHIPLASALASTAQHVLGSVGGSVEAIDVAPEDTVDTLREPVTTALDRLDAGAGVLVLADTPGATPCNIIRALLEAPGQPHEVRLVAGVSLPVLLRVCNYADAPLDERVEIARVAGQRDAIAIELDRLSDRP